jgi:septum site-determining protein MinD
MKSVTFTVSKGGIGKSLITANVGVALSRHGFNTILVEGDPNHPLQVMLGFLDRTTAPNELSKRSNLVKLDDVVKKDLEIQRAVHATQFDNLFLIPSGVSLQGYFDINPTRFARKLAGLNADYLLIDVPFPLGKAAFLSLGVCQYFIPILTEDEFTLCVESAIDTIRLGKHLLSCVPLGFVLNRIRDRNRFNAQFVKDVEDLLEIPCVTKIFEDRNVAKSYGGAGSNKAFLAYDKLSNVEFNSSIDDIAKMLEGKLPQPTKADVAGLIEQVTKTGRF